MGDRILFQVHDADTFSPVIYGHWCGEACPGLIEALSVQMRNRKGDVAYAAARLVELVTALDPGGDLSVGIWNTDHLLTEADSHGDAGVALIDCRDFSVRYLGGYLRKVTA